MSNTIPPDQSPLPSVTGYELFMGVLSVLSIVNLVFGVIFRASALNYVLMFINVILTAAFLTDFIKRILQAPFKLQYFLRDYGWADLLASLPFPQFKLFRLFRISKLYAMVRRSGSQHILRAFFENRAESALYLILFLIIILLEFGSLLILIIEGGNPAANIHTASDAIWWVYVTITTVGYGDKYPVTNAGRFIGMIVMLVGVGLFGVLTGFLANKFLPQNQPDTSLRFAKLEADLAEIKALLRK